MIPRWASAHILSRPTEELIYTMTQGALEINAGFDGPVTYTAGGRSAAVPKVELERARYRALRSRGVDVDAALRSGLRASGSFQQGPVDPAILRQAGIVAGPLGIPTRYYLYGGLGLAGLALLHMITRR